MIEMENQNLEQGSRALKILVTDESGKVLYKTKQAQEEQIDLHNTIRNAASFAINYTDGRNVFESTRKEFISFHLLLLKERICTCLLVEFQRRGNI